MLHPFGIMRWWLWFVCCAGLTTVQGECTAPLTLANVSEVPKSTSTLQPPQLTMLIDRNRMTCVNATGDKYAEVNYVIALSRCQSVSTVMIVMSKVVQLQEAPRVQLLTERKAGVCTKSDAIRRSCSTASRSPSSGSNWTIDCSSVPGNGIAIQVAYNTNVQSGVQLCEITAYQTGVATPTFASGAGLSVDINKAVQMYNISQSAFVVSNKTLILKCNAVSAVPLNYQWTIPRVQKQQAGKVVTKGDTLTITGITKSDEGYYTCKAINCYGSATENTSYVKVYEPISQPCKHGPLSESPSTINVSLSCSRPPVADRYSCKIINYLLKLRRANSGEDFVQHQSLSPTFVLPGLIPYTWYRIQAMARYSPAYCNTAPFYGLSFTARTEPVAPSPPRSVKVATITSDSVVITWSHPQYVNRTLSGYRVWYKKTFPRGTEWTFLPAIPVSHRKLLPGLDPFTSYSVCVRASNVYQKKSQWSKPSCLTVMTHEGIPSPPHNVEYSQHSSTSVRVTWQPPVHPNGVIARYRVSYVDGIHSRLVQSARVQSVQVSNDGTRVTLARLLPFTNYTAWVVAVNGKSNSSASDVVQFKTLSSAPSKPMSVVVDDIKPQAAGLRWQPPTNLNGVVQKYKVYLVRGHIDNPLPSTKSWKTVNGATRNTYLHNLVQATQYSVWIVAVNVQEGSQPELPSPSSDIAVFTTTAYQSPQKVAVSSITAVSVKVTWQKPSGLPKDVTVTGYVLDVYNTDKNRKMKIRRHNTTSTEITLERLSPYSSYLIKVAVQAGGPGLGKTASQSFKTKQSVPSAPTQLSVDSQTIGSRTATVTWTPPTHSNGELKKYRLFVREVTGDNDASPSGSQLHLTDGNLTVLSSVTFATLSGLSPSGKYSVWVVAINVVSIELISPLAGPVHFTTHPEASTPPQNARVSNITAVSVTVSWNKPIKVLGVVSQYRLIFRWNNGQKIELWTNNEPRLEQIVGRLLPYTEYSVQVSAGTENKNKSNGFLWSDGSQVIHFSTMQTVPSKPQHLNASRVWSRSAELQWKAPKYPNGDIQLYQLRLYTKLPTRSKNGHQPNWSLNNTIQVAVSTGQLLKNVSHLVPYTEYQISVVAVNLQNQNKLVSPESTKLNILTRDERPTAPSSCSIVSRSATTLQVQWKSPSPGDHKIAFYKITQKSLTDTRNDSAIAQRSPIEIYGLIPYRDYRVTVTAFTNNTRLLQGPPCQLIARTSVKTPGPPTDCRVGKEDVTSLIVGWSPPAVEDYKIVYYKVVFQSKLHYYQSVKITPGILEQKNLSAATTYNVTVTAFTNNTVLVSGPACRVTARTKGQDVTVASDSSGSGMTKGAVAAIGVLSCLPVILLAAVVCFVRNRSCAKTNSVQEADGDKEMKCIGTTTAAENTRHSEYEKVVGGVATMKNHAYGCVQDKASDVPPHNETAPSMSATGPTEDSDNLYEAID